MSWTKRQFVEMALSKIGISAYTYDVQPEDYEMALQALDAMMGTLNARGVRLGYPLPSSPETSELDDETNVPDAANQMIYTNLAIEIASHFGKLVAPSVREQAYTALEVVLGQAVQPTEQQITNLPMGAGHKVYRQDDREFLPGYDEALEAGNDSEIEFD